MHSFDLFKGIKEVLDQTMEADSRNQEILERRKSDEKQLIKTISEMNTSFTILRKLNEYEDLEILIELIRN